MRHETKTRPTYRKRPRTANVESYYLPNELLEAIERIATEEYGGNKSALVTEKLAEALEVELKTEIYRYQTA